MIQNIVAEESGHNIDFDHADIIFNILQKDMLCMDYAYEWAMNPFNTRIKRSNFIVRELTCNGS